MSLFTPTWSRHVVLMAVLLLGLGWQPAQAQRQSSSQSAPYVTDPAAQDPAYAFRKGLLATTALPPTRGHRGIQPPGTPLPDCFEPLDRTTYTPVPRNDDGSLGPIELGFQFYLFGTPYSRVYINTNGNITFNAALSTYNAAGFPTSTPMIAPFWADEDTRGDTGSRGQIWYRLYNDRLVVTWDSVGYYSNQTEKRNNFQLTIYANAGGTLAQDVVFAYGDMQWTTGNASGGTGGFGGTPANVGINEGGSGSHYTQIGRFVQDSDSYLNNTSSSGVDYLDYKCFRFRVFDAGNQPPAVVGLPTSGAITVNQGQTVTLTPQFTGPEPSQTVAVTADIAGLCNSTAVVGAGTNPTVSFSVLGATCNIGTHTVTFTATDNGTPIATSTYTLTVIVNPPIHGAVWDGDVSTDYLTPANWQGDIQPQPADSILIPVAAPRFPILTGTATAGNFTIEPGARMEVAASSVLTLNGYLHSGGPVNGLGAVSLTGSDRQNIGGAGLVRIGELLVGSAGAVQLGNFALRRVLDLTGVLTTDGYSLSLLSDAISTGMVINRGTGRVVGNATVQRYISPSLNAGTGYRHLAAPVTGMTMASVANASFVPLFNASYNTVGNTVTPFPNMFGYDQARVTGSGHAGSIDFDRGFFCPTGLSTAFADAKGYTINMPPTTVLSFTGALHNGVFSSGSLARGTQTQSGWHLLGNPYPAPLDWMTAIAGASGLDDAVYVFKSSGQYAGAYESFVNGIGSARYIGVAQGFFVRTSTPGVAGQLNLTNTARVTTYQNPSFNRSSAATDPRPQLRLDLVTSTQQQDATYVYFENGATRAFDRAYDALKLPGGNQLYLATGTPSDALSINGLPALTAAGAAVPLLTYVPQAGSFTLQVGELRNFDPATAVQLEDRETGIWHDLRQQPRLIFQASQPDAAATRFVLHVGQARALATAAALANEAVSVWPNPASTAINLHVTALPAGNDGLQLTLLNTLGQVAARQQVAVRGGQASTSLDLTGLAPGVYTLHGRTASHTFARSIVVR